MKALRLYVLAVSTLDVVASGWVKNRDAQVLIDLLPNGAALNLLKHGHGRRESCSQSTSNETSPDTKRPFIFVRSHTKRNCCQSGTHVVKASQLVHQPVELEQVQVPVAQDGPLVDGGSCAGDTHTHRAEMVNTQMQSHGVRQLWGKKYFY